MDRTYLLTSLFTAARILGVVCSTAELEFDALKRQHSLKRLVDKPSFNTIGHTAQPLFDQILCLQRFRFLTLVTF